jgi:PKD repeat protein
VNYGGSQAYNITPNTGYQVLDVLVDSVSVGPVMNYTFTNVVANHTIAATFAINQYTINATAGPNGAITPAGITTVNYGGSQAYNITPNTGYHVLDVLVDSVSQGPVTNYTFTNVVANPTIAATFGITQYTIDATAGPNGAINPAGITTVNYGGSQAYNITPNTGYQVLDVLVDSVSVGPVMNYTFTNVVANHTIAATFRMTPPVANFTATPLTGGVPLTVTFTDLSTNNPTSWLWNFGELDNGTSVLQNPSHTYFLPGNYSVELTATNDGGSNKTVRQGYIFTYYPAKANFTATPTSGSYGLSGLTVQFSDHSTGGVSSWDWNFGDGSYSEYNTHQNPGHTYKAVGLFSVNLTVANTFSSDYLLRTNYINVTPNAPTSDFETYENEEAITPLDSGFAPLSVFFYDLSSADSTSWTWDFDDGNVTTIIKDESHEFADIYHTFTSPGTYNVSLTANNAWGSDTSYKTITVTALTITASSGPNGAVTPSGVTTVNYGATPTYTITPDAGYHVVDVLVDGTSVGAVTSYTFPPVTTNKTISATFALNTYTITASSGANGAITPTGVTTVNYGGSQAYTITPTIKYHIDTLTVDGVTTTYPPKINSPYTFSNVQDNHTISVTFAKNLRQEIFFDTFDPLALTSNGWTVVSTPDRQTAAPVNGTYSIRFRGSTATGPDEAIHRSVPTTGYSEILVSYQLGAQSLESGEYFAAQYSTNGGGSYTDITRISGPYTGSATFSSYTSGALPTAADNQASNFRIRFGLWGSNTGDYGWIDDVKVTGIPDYI